jgi:hypothetical protein
MMTSAFQINATHARALPSNVVSQRYGNHMPSVRIDTDTDNGNLIAVGDWVAWDYFAEAAVTSFTGKIIAQDKNGDWVVLVTDPGDAVFVYQKPLTPYESPEQLLSEKTMYNKAGDIVRTYTLTKFDRITVSTEGFTGNDPAVGSTISGVTNKKMVVA